MTLKAGDEVDGPADLEVLDEGEPVEADVLVCEVALEQLDDAGEPEQGRVELDDHVEAVPVHQMPDHGFDLVRRAAVEGGERQGVGYPAGKVVVAEPSERRWDQRAETLDLR